MSSYYEKKLATGEVKCIDEEVPFEIPQGWEWCRLNEVATSVTDFVASGSFASLRENVKYYSTKEYALLLRTKDLSCNFSKDLVYTDKHGYDFLSNSNLFGGELILPNIGASIGKVFIVPNLNMPMTLAPNSVMIRLDDECTKSWLYNVFSSPFGYDTLWSISSSTAQGKFNKTDFRKVFVPIPPIEEQSRIVTKIKELSPYIEKYSKAQEHLDVWNVAIKEILQKSILQEAIQGKLVPQIAEEGTAQELLEHVKAEKQKLVKEGKLKKSALNDSVIFHGDDNKYWEKSGDNIVCIDEEIPFGIPSSWSWCRLGNIASVKGGKRIPVGEKLTTENTGHMYIRVADMKENTVKTDDIHYISESIYQKIKSYTISTEDLYITVAGTIGSVGEIPKVFDNANLTENADKIVFKGICKKFLMYCLLSNFVQSQIKKCTTKVGQPKLAIVRIEDLVIPLPPIKEQYRIVHKIEQTASIMSK